MLTKSTVLIFLACLLNLQLYANASLGTIPVKELLPLAVSKHTGLSAQSKTWSYNCKQWAVLPNSKGTYLWRLDGNKWTEVLKLSDMAYYADCKVLGDLAHIFLFSDTDKSYLVSLKHNLGSNSYDSWSERTQPVEVTLDKDAGTATIDIDSEGRMWLASDTKSSIRVQWSDAPYVNWSSPITLETGISHHDVSAVIAMPGKVGVLWSDQNRQRFGFKTHIDGADPDVWSENEVPASQSALNVHLGMADDHLSMAAGSDGTLYCAVKTEYDTKGYPSIALLVRRPNGEWDNLYEVSQKGTRPIVTLNETTNKVRVIYTRTDRESDIVYKESSTTNISFSPQMVLIKGLYNNVTSSKDVHHSDAVVLASNATHAVGVLLAETPAIAACRDMTDWIIYPNPFFSTTALYFTLMNGGRYKIIIYDSKGARVAQLDGNDAIPGVMLKKEIDGAQLPRGFYLVMVQSNERTKTMKLVLDK